MGYGFILSVISAFLLIPAYPRFNLEFLAWVALIPLFLALENKNLKHRFIIGYLFGIFFFSGILYWLTKVTVPGTIVLILLLSLAPAIFSLFCPSSIVHRPSSIVFVPSAWVFTEYLRSHLLSGFPWVLLGYSQSFNLPVIQIADITGVYGVSFLIILVNFGIYMVFRKIFKSIYFLFSIALLFMLVFAYGQNRISMPYPSQNLMVSVIQGNIPQEIKWDPQYRNFILEKHIALTKESLKENPQLVIWPETALPGYLEEEKDLESQITDLAKSNSIFLLVGTLREKNFKFFNSATLVSNEGKIIKNYDKIHLVPFGEFVPFGGLLSWMRGLIDKLIGDFDRGREFTVFKFKVENVSESALRIDKTTEFHSFSALICFEDIFPDLSRRFVKEGARFLVNVTNDAWFGDTPAAYQHREGSIFRAVENRVPVVRAANTGISCIIDHRGEIVDVVKNEKKELLVDGYAVGNITPTFFRTFYTRFGDVFSWLCIVVTLLGVIFTGTRK